MVNPILELCAENLSKCFETSLAIKGLDKPFNAIFIHAPYCLHAGEDVEILAAYDGHIIAATQQSVLVSSFHPELAGDPLFLELFVQMAKESCRDPAIVNKPNP